MYTIRDGRIWEHFKKIGPFKLPMVILLHFRVSQYKFKTNYCEKKVKFEEAALSMLLLCWAFLRACLDVLPVIPICSSRSTELLFGH